MKEEDGLNWQAAFLFLWPYLPHTAVCKSLFLHDNQDMKDGESMCDRTAVMSDVRRSRIPSYKEWKEVYIPDCSSNQFLPSWHTWKSWRQSPGPVTGTACLSVNAWLRSNQCLLARQLTPVCNVIKHLSKTGMYRLDKERVTPFIETAWHLQAVRLVQIHQQTLKPGWERHWPGKLSGQNAIQLLNIICFSSLVQNLFF